MEEFTAEQIVEIMVDHKEYKENVRQLLTKHFENNPELRQSWSDWFMGKPMND